MITINYGVTVHVITYNQFSFRTNDTPPLNGAKVSIWTWINVINNTYREQDTKTGAIFKKILLFALVPDVWTIAKQTSVQIQALHIPKHCPWLPIILSILSWTSDFLHRIEFYEEMFQTIKIFAVSNVGNSSMGKVSVEKFFFSV